MKARKKRLNPNSAHLSPDVRLQRAIAEIGCLDISVSVPTPGTLFRYDLSTPIGKAQAQAAQIYNVPFSYFSTNGTTSLNVMALLTVAQPGDAVIIQRDSHVSVLAPMILAGLHPIYIRPTYSGKLGITVGVTPDQLFATLSANPKTRSVFLTYPNYFGIATDIKALAEITREKKLPLIVDSAHGSHWPFHPGFPISAQTVGADIVTYSTHKTCPALGQGSLIIFTNETLVPRFYEVVNNLGFVSTSFSFPILFALVNGINLLHYEGEKMLDERLAMAAWMRDEINMIPGLHCFGVEEKGPGFVAMDPLRITIDVSETGLTGYEMEELITEEIHHYAEMGTVQNVLFLITPGTGWEDARNLVEALRRIASVPRPLRHLPDMTPPDIPRQALPIREAFFTPNRRRIATPDAVGLVSAETISAYPPGSAVIVQGEEVTHEVIEFLTQVRRHGGFLKGASDPEFETMQVLAL